MGFAVNCEGADLIQHIRTGEDELFGRRYPLYIIALATEVDDDAIKWLVEYGRALDSLTGNSIAFVTFYNSVRLYATMSTGYSHVVDQEGTRQIFKYTLPDITVPPQAIHGSWTLRQYLNSQIIYPPDEAFISSMTYESDSVARYLGVKPTQLPCLLFLDDPNDVEYYILPIKSPNKEFFDTLREIVGEFYSHPNHTTYLQIIAYWDSLKAKEVRLMNELKGEERLVEYLRRDILKKFPKDHLQIQTLENKGAAELILKRWLNDVFGYTIPKDITANIIDKFHQISPIFLDYQQRVAKLKSGAWYFVKALSKGELSEQQRSELCRFYAKTLSHFIPKDLTISSINRETDVGTWKLLFEIALNSPIKNDLEKFIPEIQKSINEMDLQSILSSRLERIREKEIGRLKQQISEIDSEIDRIKITLDQMDRPRIGPILKKINWEDRKEVTSAMIGRTLSTVGRGAETVMKAVELGLKLTGIP